MKSCIGIGAELAMIKVTIYAIEIKAIRTGNLASSHGGQS